MFISYVFYFYWSVNFDSKVGLEEILAVKKDFLVFYFFISWCGLGISVAWGELYSWPDECEELTQKESIMLRERRELGEKRRNARGCAIKWRFTDVE